MPVKRIPLERHDLSGVVAEPPVDKGEDVEVAPEPPAKKVSNPVPRTPRVTKKPAAAKKPATKKPVAKKA